MKETLQETVETSKGIKVDISEAITQLKNENPDENIDSVLQKLEDIQGRLDEKEFEASEIASTLTVTKNNNVSEKIVTTIEKFIKDRYPAEYRMNKEDFINEVSDQLKYSRITILRSIRKLEQENKVQTHQDLLDVNVKGRLPWQ
ncbi:hypothetical protein BKP35_16320 [Anaerobacillus arseniciselenatis]|uniref:Uncharacterized protein n=1 Tax=Anaerobacillus arseniciselenatis TaxID=85682 RepID=A0A1S2LAA8_9BACI|nr:hypothetical protein [Anaerobacillus arseniciselenatis]OIJ09419.1 hypothetical protein BKP35_16320 [Anaerobacillus arseniciselenatis]